MSNLFYEKQKKWYIYLYLPLILLIFIFYFYKEKFKLKINGNTMKKEANIKNNKEEPSWDLSDLYNGIKDRELETLQDYQESYGDNTYGLVAYILNIIRLYSIPFGFVGIAISGIYRYIIGIRKLDVRDKGFGAMIGIITVMVICQVLPLVFAIVVKGWRG